MISDPPQIYAKNKSHLNLFCIAICMYMFHLLIFYQLVLISSIFLSSGSFYWCLTKLSSIIIQNDMLASVAQLYGPSDWRPGGRGFNPLRGRQHSFMEIDHEIFSTVILSLPLIQEGQLSVSGERMCTILVNPLED